MRFSWDGMHGIQVEHHAATREALDNEMSLAQRRCTSETGVGGLLVDRSDGSKDTLFIFDVLQTAF